MSLCAISLYPYLPSVIDCVEDTSLAAIKDRLIKIGKHIKRICQYAITADSANPLVMNIFISLFTIVFLAMVLVFLIRESPNNEDTYYYRLVIDTYVPSVFTLCVSIIIQTFVEATRESNTRFMLNLLALSGSFIYLFVYVLLPQSPSVSCLIGVLVGSFVLLLLCLFAMKQILLFENTDANRIAASERSGI